MAILTEPRKLYWDACVWIALIGGEVGRADQCESIVAMARARDFQIWTSSLTLVEVYKHRMAPPVSGALRADKDQEFEAFMLQDFVDEVQVDHEIALRARRLLRENFQLKKPKDAIHLATALVNNLDEFHTFDGVNLIPLSLKVARNDGVPLLIREPPPPVFGKQADLFVVPPQSAPPPA